MSEKIVDARIKFMKEMKGKSDETLLDNYIWFVRNGSEKDWLPQMYRTEILERMTER